MILILSTLLLTGVIFMSEKLNKIPESEKYDGIFQIMASKYNIPDWKWLKAIALAESDLGRDPRVANGETSRDGKSWGIMQIAPEIGSEKEIELKGPKNIPLLNVPEYNIEIGAKLVGYLWSKYQDKDKVFLAYNQGERNTDLGKNYTIATTPPFGYDVKINNNLEKIA